MTTRTVELSALDEHPLNIELYGETTIDPDLVESIKRHGILQKVQVTPFGQMPGTFLILSGHRRVKNAKAAGLTDAEMEIWHYESAEDVALHLVESNNQRVKTKAQIRREILTLKSTLSEIARNNQTQGLKQGEESSDSPLGRNRPNGDDEGRTNAVIADKLGVSEYEVKKVVKVGDTQYRDAFSKKLRGWGATDAQVSECMKLWAGIHRKLDSGEMSDGDAVKAVDALMKDFSERCPKYRKPKKAKPAKPAKAPKPKKGETLPIAVQDATPEQAEVFTPLHRLQYNGTDVVVGHCDYEWFAVQVEGRTMVVGWPNLIHTIHRSLQ